MIPTKKRKRVSRPENKRSRPKITKRIKAVLEKQKKVSRSELLSKMKKEIGKLVLVQERISEKRFKIGTSQRNQKTSEFGRNHKSEKKVRNLEKSERNQKRKSEKKVRNLEKCPKRNKKSKYMVAVLFDGSCAQLWEKGEKLILVKSWK